MEGDKPPPAPDQDIESIWIFKSMSRRETAAHQTGSWHGHNYLPCLEQKVNDAQRQQSNGHAKYSQTSNQGQFLSRYHKKNPDPS